MPEIPWMSHERGTALQCMFMVETINWFAQLLTGIAHCESQRWLHAGIVRECCCPWITVSMFQWLLHWIVAKFLGTAQLPVSLFFFSEYFRLSYQKFIAVEQAHLISWNKLTWTIENFCTTRRKKEFCSATCHMSRNYLWHPSVTLCEVKIIKRHRSSRSLKPEIWLSYLIDISKICE